ncbi:MAG: hypothetical protein WCO56_27910, partial [Verrucomicrobiota bacterium]
KTLSVPNKTLSVPNKTLSVPNKTLSGSDKTLSGLDKTLSDLDKTLSHCHPTVNVLPQSEGLTASSRCCPEGEGPDHRYRGEARMHPEAGARDSEAMPFRIILEALLWC